MLNDLTPDQLSAAYDFMRIMPPFSSYKIPPSDNVEFRIVNDRRLHGWHKMNANGVHVLAMSRNGIGHTATLMHFLAHELIHLIQAERGTYTKAAHNAEFKKIAAKVCEIHGFDLRSFV